jgi:hypothetical protein
MDSSIVLKIAVTGAPSTGKHQLASDLGRALRDAGREALVAVTDLSAPPGGTAGHGLTLLCGLESAALAHQQAADQSIRAALAAGGAAYCVLYGNAPQRLTQALGAVERLLPGLPQQTPAPVRRDGNKAWVWVCDKCSDPVCEHRLLSDLLAQRAVSAAP